MKKTIFYTDAKGHRVPIELDLNKDLGSKPKKASKLAKKIATGALVLSLGVGAVIGAGAIFNACGNTQNVKPTTNTTSSTESTVPQTTELAEDLRFDPNTKESVIDNAVLLIEEAARGGKELDAEDAVLAVIAANSNELTAGFMGELFGERANQTYTYSSIVDAYLRVCQMQNENVGFAKTTEVAFNIEDVFANKEDYTFLCTIRDLTTRFNNSNDETEKAEITKQLNKIAADLCGYDVYDISNSVGVLSMLTLDGMRTTTITTKNPILHNDIRDEMFGDGDYACTKEAKYTSGGQVLQTAYSLRVSDLKLDTIKTKLDNAVLVEGKTTILDEIVAAVEEQTKNVEINNIDIAGEINKQAEANREVTYAYESKPGVEKDGYSEKTDKDKTTKVNGKDVVVIDGSDKKKKDKDTDKDKKPSTTNPTTPTTSDPEPATPNKPEIKTEEDVKPDKDDKIHGDRDDAEDDLQSKWEQAQADSDQGSIDGEYYGKNGLPKPSFKGKSKFYINAFNTNYEFWYNKFLKNSKTANSNATTAEQTTVSTAATVETTEVIVAETTSETYNLDGLSKEQLEELKSAAVGEEEYTESKTKTK